MATKTKRVAKSASKPRATTTVQPIPVGYPPITPYLRVRSAEQALAFYKKPFGAKEKSRMAGPDGRVMRPGLPSYPTCPGIARSSRHSNMDSSGREVA